MDKKKIFIIVGICIVVAVFICLGILFYKKGSKDLNNNTENIVLDEESKTKDIQDVEYEDITLYKDDGTIVKLSESKYKPVMLLFWDENNEDSVAVLKKVEELYKNYEGTIDFYMISCTQTVKEDIKKDLSIEIYYDLDRDAQKKYRITEFPSMIYINEENEVFNAKAGFTTTDSLEANLDILSNNI